jgi:hypothetical protein
MASRTLAHSGRLCVGISIFVSCPLVR